MTKKKSKFGNECVYLNKLNLLPTTKDDPHSIYFPSILEAETFKILKGLNCIINRQHKIQVTASTDRFPGIYWDCDFRIFHKSKDCVPSLNIEAKGLSLDTFPLKLNLLDRTYPRHIDNLIIVVRNFSTPIPKSLDRLKRNGHIVPIAKLAETLILKGY